MSEQNFADRVNAELEKMGADPLTPAQADALDEPSGLPQSEYGGLHPELRARITAAKAVTDDYKRWIDGETVSGDHADYAARLWVELRDLLRTIEKLS